MSSVRDSYKKPQLDGGGGDFKKPFPLVDGKNLFRLVPPVPQLSADGKWFKFFAQHFGYKAPNRDGKEVFRTFVCPRVYNSKTKEEKVPCAECHKIERQATLLKKREVQYAEAGDAPDVVASKVMALKEWLSSHNRDVKYFIHVMSAAGEFGYVKLGSTAFYQLKDRIKELDTNGIDAFSPDQGVWFSVNKSGKGFNTEYTTTVEMEHAVINGRKMQTEKLAPLTDEQLDLAIAQCPQFDKLVNVIPSRMIDALAASNGTPAEVAAIMGVGSPKREASPAPAAAASPEAAALAARIQAFEDGDDEAAEPAPVAQRPSAPLTPGSARGEPLAAYEARVRAGIGTNAAPAAPELSEEDAEAAELERKLAAIKARKVGAPVQAPRQAAPKPAAPAFDPRDPKTTAEDFINQFGEE